MTADPAMSSMSLPPLRRTAISLAMLLVLAQAHGAPTVFTNQTDYLDALSTMGYVWVHESFEDDEIWGHARTPATATTVTNFSVRWRANNESSQLTTSSGAALVGDWGVYADPHGSYTVGGGCTVPGACGDGLIGAAPEPFYGVAGWARGFYGSKVALFLNGDLGTPVEFPEVCDPSGENCVAYGFLTSGFKFFGIIEPTGFSSFEFREMEGTIDDVKYVWLDEFTMAFTNVPPPRFDAVMGVSNGVTLSVKGLAVNAHYTLERSASLMTNAWIAVQGFTANGSETNLSEAIDVDPVHRFYRLKSP